MFQAQIGKRLSERNPRLVSTGYFHQTRKPFCRLRQLVSLFLSEAAINQTPFSTSYERFGCPILSLIVWNVSAYLTTGFMYQLYNGLSRKTKRID
jgi:hypothetical protein